MLQNARFRAEAAISELDPDKDNFYSIIESAKELIKDNEWWVVDQQATNTPSQVIWVKLFDDLIESQWVEIRPGVKNLTLAQLILLILTQQPSSHVLVCWFNAQFEVFRVVWLLHAFQESADECSSCATIKEVGRVHDAGEEDTAHKGVCNYVPQEGILAMRQAEEILYPPPSSSKYSSEGSVSADWSEDGAAPAWKLNYLPKT